MECSLCRWFLGVPASQGGTGIPSAPGSSLRCCKVSLGVGTDRGSAQCLQLFIFRYSLTSQEDFRSVIRISARGG